MSRRKHMRDKKFRDSNKGSCNTSLWGPFCDICKDKAYKSLKIPKRAMKKLLEYWESDEYKEKIKKSLEEKKNEFKTMTLPRCNCCYCRRC